MGIPKFFRWVAERFPLVITPFQESPPQVDNLYLDMNGIIHNCTHPNDIDASRRAPTEKEMAEAMFAYLEKLFQAIQPRKYFFLAVDGCAPRAKMNQQRQRRYRSGYEMMVAREEALARGEELPDEGDVFDSNCITPGTEFMVRFSEHFQYFITMKIQQDSAWRNCKIIYSGQDQPGEGEHKIVDFIRRRKMQEDYCPDETHCMYGLDADLIMLAMATHEPHFILLREVVSFSQPSKKEKERAAEDAAKGIVADESFKKADSFVLFHVGLLREHLDLDVRRGKPTLPNYDLERMIDDFVFMCSFIGNDFLPAIPTLAINDGSMTTMMEVYREHVLNKGANLVRGGKPNWNAVDIFLAKIGTMELETLRQRQDEELEFAKRRAKMDQSREAPVPQLPIASMAEYKERFYTAKHGFVGWQPRGAEMADLKQHYVEGLMWVMEYYYQGPPSWKWFYPHHYAPMASDLVNLTTHATNVKFERETQAFLPHQQLLAVLPPMSYRSMPKAYWPLLKSSNSPLLKYFPKHLEIDREGARAPWEGTVLIPFIDEKVLLAAFASVQGQLTDLDRKRNAQGPALLFEFDSEIEPYSFSSTIFRRLENVRVRRQPYQFPAMPHPFVPALCRGVRMGAQHMEGYGSLFAHIHEMTTSYEVGAVNIFGMPSRKESMLLNIAEGDVSSAESCAHLVGQEVWIGFPHFKRARVCGVVDRSRRLSATWDKDGNFNGLLAESLTGEEFRQFKKDSELHTQFLKSKCGIVLPGIDVLVYVNRFIGMRISRKGRFLHQWAKKDTCYPLQLVTRPETVDMLEDAQLVEREREEGDFVSGTQIIYVGPEPKGQRGESVLGSVGYVLDRQIDGDQPMCNVLLKQWDTPQAVPQSVIDTASTENWMSLYDVCDQLKSRLKMNLTPGAISQLCSNVTTSPQWGSQELGLCMKFTSKNLTRVGLAKLVSQHYNPWYVGNANVFAKMEDAGGDDLGYHLAGANEGGDQRGGKKGDQRGGGGGGGGAQHDKGQWYFSSQAFFIIEDYIKAFTPLITSLMGGNVNGAQYDMTACLTGAWADKDPEWVMSEIGAWIGERGLHEMPMISATDDAFSVDVIQELEQVLEQTTPRESKEIKLRRVHNRHIYFPTAQVSAGFTVAIPLPNKDQKYALGNRVVYCRTTGGVPFGMTGTIVRLLGDGKTAEVVYDLPFLGGSHLGGRLKTSRGHLTKFPALLVTSTRGQSADESQFTPGSAPQQATPQAASPQTASPPPQEQQQEDKKLSKAEKKKAAEAAKKAQAASPAQATSPTQAQPPQQAQQPPAQQQQREKPGAVWPRQPRSHTSESIKIAFNAQVMKLLTAKYGGK
jgi:5'-3' exoribonuclease 1